MTYPWEFEALFSAYNIAVQYHCCLVELRLFQYIEAESMDLYLHAEDCKEMVRACLFREYNTLLESFYILSAVNQFLKLVSAAVRTSTLLSSDSSGG